MKYIFFGAGNNGERYVRTLSEFLGGDELHCFVDNHKAGMIVCGKPVIDFDELKRIYKNYTLLVTISKKNLLKEVINQLEDAGIPYELFDNAYCFKLLKEKINIHPDYYQKFKAEIDCMLSMGKVEMVPYPFRKYYLNQDVTVQYLPERDLYCYDYKGRSLFFPRFPDRTSSENTELVQTAIKNLLTEQDESSPHRYFTSGHYVSAGDIFIDIGAAEAMTSLDVVEIASKVYIFEGEKKWQKALQATFASYGDKVVIVDKFVGDHDDSHTIKMDTYFEKIKGTLFIKVDIEGSERSFLNGAEKVLQRKGTKVSLCVYHYPHDAEDFMLQFQKWGYKCELSQGWLFVWGDFARGVMYGQFL